MGSIRFNSVKMNDYSYGKNEVTTNTINHTDENVKIALNSTNKEIQKDIGSLSSGTIKLSVEVSKGNIVTHMINLNDPENRIVFNNLKKSLDDPNFKLSGIEFKPRIDANFAFQNQVLMNVDSGLTGHEGHKKIDNPHDVLMFGQKEVRGNDPYKWGGGGVAINGNPTKAQEGIMRAIGEANGKMPMGVALTMQEALTVAKNYVNENMSTENINALGQLFPNLDFNIGKDVDGKLKGKIVSFQTTETNSGSKNSDVQKFVDEPKYATGRDSNFHNYNVAHNFDNTKVYNEFGKEETKVNGKKVMVEPKEKVTPDMVLTSMRRETMIAAADFAYRAISQEPQFAGLTGPALSNAMESQVVVDRIKNYVKNAEGSISKTINEKFTSATGTNEEKLAEVAKAMTKMGTQFSEKPNNNNLSITAEAVIEGVYKRNGNGIDLNPDTQQVRANNTFMPIPQAPPEKAAPVKKGPDPLNITSITPNDNAPKNIDSGFKTKIPVTLGANKQPENNSGGTNIKPDEEKKQETNTTNTIPENKNEKVEVKGEAKHKVRPVL